MAPSHSVTETDKQSFVSLKGGHARDLDNEIIKGEREIEGRKVEYSLSIYDAPGMPRIKA